MAEKNQFQLKKSIFSCYIGLFLVMILLSLKAVACTAVDQATCQNNVTSEIGSTLLDYSLTETLISDSLTIEVYI